jgi:hypothetical protein
MVCVVLTPQTIQDLLGPGGVGNRAGQMRVEGNMMRTARPLLALVAAAALTLTGCGLARGGTTPGGDQRNRVGGDAETWQEPASYAFTLASACGERDLIGTFRLTVVDGMVTAAEGGDEPGRRLLLQRQPHLLPTLAGLLNEARQAQRDGADVVETLVDPADGHPTKISIDYDRDAMDDEACYTISDYVTPAPKPEPTSTPT